MPVAKSFQSMEIVDEPYERDKRWYVRVRSPRGSLREVRWYSEAEYRKMYPEEKVEERRIRPMKDVLGFKNGYITIFKGNIDAVEDWFKAEKVCKFHTIWGWYISSEDEMPTLPAEVSAVQLPWESVSNPDGSFKPTSAIIKAIEALIYEPSTSKHFGAVGERLDLIVEVIRVIPLEDHFGKKTFHLFRTSDGNIASWTTAARTLDLNKQYKLRATISAHEIYKGEPQTRLTRCTEVK